MPKLSWASAGEGHLVDVPAGGLFRVAVGVSGQVRVGAASGRDEREPGPVVGVVGKAAVFGGRADGDDVGSARGVGDRARGPRCRPPRPRARPRGARSGCASISSGMSEAVMLAENSRLRLITWAPWFDGEAHAFGDRGGFAFALAVEHPHGHDPGAVGEAGEAVAVVGRPRRSSPATNVPWPLRSLG